MLLALQGYFKNDDLTCITLWKIRPMFYSEADLGMFSMFGGIGTPLKGRMSDSSATFSGL